MPAPTKIYSPLVAKPTNMIINGNTDGGGHSDGVVWHNNGVFDITQGPNPQNMP